MDSRRALKSFLLDWARRPRFLGFYVVQVLGVRFRKKLQLTELALSESQHLTPNTKHSYAQSLKLRPVKCRKTSSRVGRSVSTLSTEENEAMAAGRPVFRSAISKLTVRPLRFTF